MIAYKSIEANPTQECRLIRGGLHDERFVEVFLAQADKDGKDLRFLTNTYIFDQLRLQDLIGKYFYDEVVGQLLEIDNGRYIAEIIMEINDDDTKCCVFKNGDALDLRPSNIRVCEVEI